MYGTLLFLPIKTMQMHVRTLLRHMVEFLNVPQKCKIGLPMIGAGYTGGNWAIIQVMIEETLVKTGHDVTIYKL